MRKESKMAADEEEKCMIRATAGATPALISSVGEIQVKALTKINIEN